MFCTESMDFQAGPFMVNFTKGTNSTEFCINIVADRRIEDDIENFTITINDTTLGPNIYLGEVSTATVEIIDDECKYLVICTL